MDRIKQIKAWRDIVELTISFVGRVSDHNQDLDQFILAVRQGLDTENWSNFERILKAIFFGFSPTTGMYSFAFARRNLKEELVKALEYFDPEMVSFFGVEIKADGLVMKPTANVDLCVTKGSRSEIVFRFKFADPKTGTTFNELMGKRLGSNHGVQFGEVVYEDALHIEAALPLHWIFSKESRERLGERVTAPRYDPFNLKEAFVVRPLLGENLVVYDGQGARDIGLHVPYSRTAPRHPDTTVFASFGQFALAMKRGEPQRGRPGYDRVVVFVDDRLPIAPPPRDVFEDDVVRDGYGHDGDPADRDPVEY